MKLETLAIIFLLIIMPITMVLSEYVGNKIQTEKTRMAYDTRLLNATYDAVKAYQINTVNNAFGDVTNEKVKDISAAAKTLYNSLASNFNYSGYQSDVMKEYVPAIVFTTYDGYYIYSPFTNVITEVPEGPAPPGATGGNYYDPTYSQDGEIQEGCKPYVYYTCRYIRGSDDFYITYTLDNYITIQGIINGQYIYDYGYLYSIGNSTNKKGIYKVDDDTYGYDGIDFSNTDTEELKEFFGIYKEYSYAKINGTKYYLDEHYYTDRVDEHLPSFNNGTRTVQGINDVSQQAGIFYIDSDGAKNYSQTKGYLEKNTPEENENFYKYCRAIKNNKSAYEYYKNAYEFSCTALGKFDDLHIDTDEYEDKMGNKIKTISSTGYNLQNLTVGNSYPSQNLDPTITEIGNAGDSIFTPTTADANTNNNIEYANSAFQQHRKAVIRYCIESNLIASISSFQSKVDPTYDFIMPKISEEDWETIGNDVCTISFMQGMSIGANKYNGYAVVSNTLTNDYIDENDIYILTKEAGGVNTYCKANDSSITDATVSVRNDLTYSAGVWKLNFQKRIDSTGDTTTHYIPLGEPVGVGGKEQGYVGSYTSVMGSYGINSIATSDMYRYMAGKVIDTKTDMPITVSNELKEAYYKGLGRERWGAFNVNNINYELYGTNGNEYFLKAYEQP